MDREIADLRRAGVEVLPFLRSSDELRPADRALLPISPIWSPLAQRELRALLRRERPDLLHMHNVYPLISPWAVRTAHALGVPVVQTVHNYRHVCPSSLFFREGRVCHDCRDRRVALPAIRHRCYRGSAAQSAVMAAALALHRGTWRSVDSFVALTSDIADYLVGFGVAADRIVVKPNGLDDPGEPEPAGEGVCFAGRLSPEKGLGLLLEAWAHHPVGSLGTLRVAGDGELRPRVEEAARERADVVWLGRLDPGGVRQAMSRSALVAVPSLWPDVLPTVVLEALAAGRPVLGTPLGGVPYLVGDAGWLVEPSARAWAAALPGAVRSAPGLGEAARRRYLAEFRSELSTARLVALYRRVAGGGRPGGRH